jgi:outer membrane protein assembly factor BamB
MRLFSGGGLLLSCFPLYLTSVLAVFQDDAFHIDWHIPLIGSSLETSTFFHRPNSKTRASLVYTLTDRSILAAINPKDGELVWRQSLAEEPVGMSDGVARRGNGIIIAGVRGTITSLDASNGKIIWENEFSDDIVDLRVFLDTSNENAVAVLFKNGAVRLLHPRTGDVAWQWNEISRYI